MSDSAAPRKSAFTLDEIIEIVSDIARNPDDRDRLRALKLLTTLNSSVAAIPPPLTDDDVVDRMVRLMKGAGAKLCRKAYRKAYPLSLRAPNFDPEEMKDLDIFTKGKIQHLKTLKQFNRMFPETVKGGVPPGYPVGAGPEAQAEWVQRAATKIFIERRRREIAQEAEAVKTEDALDDSGYDEGE